MNRLRVSVNGLAPHGIWFDWFSSSWHMIRLMVRFTNLSQPPWRSSPAARLSS